MLMLTFKILFVHLLCSNADFPENKKADFDLLCHSFTQKQSEGRINAAGSCSSAAP